MIRNKLIAVLLTGVIVLNTPLAAFASTEQQRSDSVHKAVDYLETQQAADGGIKSDTFGDVSDWAIIAVEAADLDPANVKTKSGTSLEDYSKNNKPAADAPITAIEKKMLAVKASGKDTTNFEGINYDQVLASKEVNGQIGDETSLNDDYFGILASEGTNNQDLKTLAASSLDFVIRNQETDGGYSYTTESCAWCGSDSNDTSAAIQAMYAAERMGISTQVVVDSRNRAVAYLLTTQNEDGGFGYDVVSVSDTASTAWALMALNLVGDSVKPQALRAQDWLLRVQNSDGGFRNQIAPCAANDQWCSNLSDAYATSHAIIALLGSSWSLNPEPLELMPLSRSVSINNVFYSNIQSKLVEEAKTDLTSFASASSAASRFTLAAKNAQQENFKIAATDSPTNKKVAAKESNLSIIGLSVLAAFALGWFAWFMVKSKQTGGSNV
ncbi:terpene cyclase/mutase family protein [Candidatus Saccharibacteria bacterium]|nr:terpene cyclase/mutase family protein [Candidatus Saccharibacteria bacterium]